MRGYGQRNGGGILRWITIVVAIFCVLFILSGAIIGSNYQQIGNLLTVISLVRGQYIEPVQTDTLVEGATRGIVDSLEDPYSVYLDADIFQKLQEQILGSFGGLGILVGLKEETLIVARVYEDTPATKAGILADDIIVGIDDRDVRGLDLDTAVDLMRGPVGSEVKVTIVRGEQLNLLEFTIIRQEISVPSIEGEMLAGTSIGYVIISQFTEKTPEDLGKALDKLQEENMQGLIIDLRSNPGGELIAATRITDVFIPEGPIVFIEYRNGSVDEKRADDRYLDLPLVVLVNGMSASASEILAGAIQDTESGTLVGTRTFGKGLVQTVFGLDNNTGLKLTTARYLTPNKNDIHGKGIQPDVVIEDLPEVEGDEQLEKAISIIEQEIQ